MPLPTTPEPLVERHVPFTAKQPVLSEMPFANVDVAPVTSSAVVWMPPANVDVASPMTAKFVDVE